MEKNTVATYGLVIVSVLIIAALLMTVTPLGNMTTDAIQDIVAEYQDKTRLEGGTNSRDEVDRVTGNQVMKTVTLNFVYENGQEIVPKTIISCNYGDKVNVSEKMPTLEGYVPNYTPAEQTVTKNLDYTITYYPKQYSITYHLNEGTIVSSRPNTYMYGQVTNLPTKVMRDGYTFLGWYEDEECLNKKITTITADRNENITVYAKWSNTKYSITYISNDEDITSEVTGIKEILYGQDPEKLPTLPGTGTRIYFSGWYDNPSFKGASITHTPVYPDDNLVYYAKWTINNGYKIEYVENGGKFYGTIPEGYTAGTPITLPRNIKKTGYAFAGWYDNAEFEGDEIVAIKSTDTGDKKFYAKWNAIQYTINYDLNGGTINGEVPVSYKTGDEVVFPTNVIKNGSKFKGWRDANTNEMVEKTTPTQHGNIYLIAEYDEVKYSLILDANGGLFEKYLFDTGVTEDQPLYTKLLGNNEKYGVLPTPYRKGYQHLGWYTTKEGNTTVTAETIFKAPTTMKTTIYAHWKPLEYTITYKIGHDEKWETEPKTTFTYGTAYTIPTNITKPHHTFDGWYTDENLSADSKIKVIPDTYNDNIVLYPKWNPNKYTVTCNPNGGAISNIENEVEYTYTYGIGLELPIPKRDKYEFSHWTDANNNIIHTISPTDYGNKELTAQWISDKTLRIKINLYDKDKKTITNEDGQALTCFKTGVILDSPFQIDKDEITKEFGIDNIYYHDEFTIIPTADNFNDNNIYEYNLIVRPYKMISITSSVDTEMPFTDQDKEYKFRQDEEIDIDDIIMSSGEYSCTFNGAVRINGTREECPNTAKLKELLTNIEATTEVINVVLLYNEYQYTITWVDKNNSNINPPIKYPENLQQHYYSSKGYTWENQPTRQCYKFMGWTATIGDEEINIGNEIPIGTKGNIKLTPKWLQEDENSEVHDYKIDLKPTCQQVGKEICEFCGIERELMLTEHDWSGAKQQFFGTNDGYIRSQDENGNEVIIYETDIPANEYHKITCSYENCGVSLYEKHNFEITKNGKTSRIHHDITCKDCNYTEIEEHTFEYTATDKEGHAATCVICLYKFEENHSSRLYCVETSEEYHTHACGLCHYRFKDVYWDKEETINNITYKTCSQCDGKYTSTKTLEFFTTTMDDLKTTIYKQVSVTGYLYRPEGTKTFYMVDTPNQTYPFKEMVRYNHRCTNPNCSNKGQIVKTSDINDDSNFSCDTMIYKEENGVILEETVCGTLCSKEKVTVMNAIQIEYDYSNKILENNSDKLLQIVGILQTDENGNYIICNIECSVVEQNKNTEETPQMIEILNNN
jgi:uncharacterized repeat protein (TIGR02543 family)